MTLRSRLAILTALAVAAAVIAVSLTAYFATRQRLRNEVDNTLRARAQVVAGGPELPRRGPGGFDPNRLTRDPYAETDVFYQAIDGTGTVVGAPALQDVLIPVKHGDAAIAAAGRGSYFHDATTSDGLHLRVLTVAAPNGEALQIARSLSEVDASLGGLRNILFGVSGAGIVLAGILGLLIAQRSLRPVARLTAAAEHVAATQELDATIEVRSSDEIGRLAHSFNEMLQALQESRRQQQQLVSDASHELRTPLTSLRTNIEVLIRGDLPERDRQQLLRDVTLELEELTGLVGELVELASERRPDAQAFEDIRLDQLAESVVDRARRRSGLRIELAAEPTLVVGNYTLLERAAGNLVDNACKWSPPDRPIEVSVAAGVFKVRDYGAGIAEEDRPHVFDRFYRAEAARGKPGSGLGLAIVRQVIEAHGGRAWVEPAPGGGTVAAFQLESVPLEIDKEMAAGTA